LHDNTTELYDPATDTWSWAGDMLTHRFDHVAVRLLDGNVLVAGGRTKNEIDQSITNSAELYNPAKNIWTSLPSMNIARADFTAALLPDGKVLVIGGRLQSGDPTPTTEIYDFNTRRWQLGDGMRYARQDQSDLQDRQVFFEDRLSQNK
jgi:N-acetylneuraminic acid mutarotase